MHRRKRNYNTNLIKSTMTYSTNDIAELFGIHKVTVLNWYKAGLVKIDDKRPFLVLGWQLEIFLKDRQARRRRKCRLNELYCFKCRMPKKPKMNKVILSKLNDKIGRLNGICCKCGSKINKIVSLRELNRIKKSFKITKTRNKDLSVSVAPNVNINFEEESST